MRDASPARIARHPPAAQRINPLAFTQAASRAPPTGRRSRLATVPRTFFMSTNPIVQAIKTGQAPKMARLAAARGMLPLGPEESLEALVALAGDSDEEIKSAASASLEGFNAQKLRPVVENPDLSPEVLGYLATWQRLPRELYQPVILHNQVPDDALAHLAKTATTGDVIELIALKQQSLIRNPAIIEAILSNPVRTPEAERRAREVKQEFFEKDFGAQVVAGEQRAQSDGAAAGEAPAEKVVFYDDLSQFIEADLIDTGDALFEKFEADFGPVENMVGIVDELDLDALFRDEVVQDLLGEQAEPERISVLARIARMTVKEKIRFALKGTREVRMILVRDPNRPVCAAVIQNPRITEAEIEAISNLKGINEEVLRLIGNNRNWTKNYAIILNLCKNPKTPVPLTLNFLNRLQNRDLRELAKSKNVPEVIRQMAARINTKRSQG